MTQRSSQDSDLESMSSEEFILIRQVKIDLCLTREPKKVAREKGYTSYKKFLRYFENHTSMTPEEFLAANFPNGHKKGYSNSGKRMSVRAEKEKGSGRMRHKNRGDYSSP